MSYNLEEKRKIIMDHYLKPVNKKENINFQFEEFGISCSDHLEYKYKIENNKIVEIIFNGQGCAFFIAATDILCSLIKNKTIDEAIELINCYELFINGKELKNEELKKMGELQIFDNVKQHYNRLNCALMLANSLREKLKNE
nr:iron-sulfur cluster assembly scaffold protein [Mycoplasmopsis lipofaciens]